ncbi:MAG: YecA family protein [Wenzhouxiangellaceae bacterium]
MLNTYESKLAWLLALASDPNPERIAETHGVVIGLLVGRPGQSDQQIASELAALQVGDWTSDKIQEHLGPAIATLRSELSSPDMDFQPLLPTDERPLEERTACLAAWVSGFLAGFGAVATRPDRNPARETLLMFEQIARAGTSPDEDDETQEQAYAELCEFVRMAALLLREQQLGKQA